MQKKTGSNVYQFPVSKNKPAQSIAEVLRQTVGDVLQELESTPPTKTSARKQSTRTTPLAKGARTETTARRDVNVETGSTTSVTAIHGGTNIIGNQGTVSVVHVQKPPKVRHTIQPNDDHITQAQRVELYALKDEWVTLHNTLKGTPLSHKTAWQSINKAGGATSYREICKDRFAEAVAFVKKEMAILRNMKSAPRKDDEWRTKKIGAIKARCKNQFNGVDVYKPYIKKNFGANSLTELATDELQRTYAHIMAKKAVRGQTRAL